jgi:hypothetical protein
MVLISNITPTLDDETLYHVTTVVFVFNWKKTFWPTLKNHITSKCYFKFSSLRLYYYFFKHYLTWLDVCHLLTKEYIQVELQIQYMLYNFLDGLSPHTWYG